ncbi:hypothetical protein DB41_HF00070 [Neochlamydia sp. TUME1]|uniref:leucine-rich repeat domain-containing protein n=1 Tax=Neochlamydia sp. TUME1 TaxID=1478174 RepID=UPI00057E745C|nr:leucine-rich repeat domain-containing protein [Neochlamydia sp. TUME1]KIC75778.1 hypothetical protein DB41_HF00070 [Neochlamydia sp. TUME1]
MQALTQTSSLDSRSCPDFLESHLPGQNDYDLSIPSNEGIKDAAKSVSEISQKINQLKEIKQLCEFIVKNVYLKGRIYVQYSRSLKGHTIARHILHTYLNHDFSNPKEAERICLKDIMQQIEQIQFLELSGAKLTNLPAYFKYLTGLQHLNLCANNLTSLPPELKELVNLQELNLNGNHSFEELPPFLDNMNLKVIKIGNTKVNKASVKLQGIIDPGAMIQTWIKI